MNANVKVGEEFRLNMRIKSAQDAYSAMCQLIYPSDAIELVVNPVGAKPEVEKGDFFGASTEMLVTHTIDPPQNVGTLMVVLSKTGNQDGEIGEGTLCTVQARAAKAGEYALTWGSNSSVLDENQKELENRFDPLTIQIAGEAMAKTEMNVVYLTVEPVETEDDDSSLSLIHI